MRDMQVSEHSSTPDSDMSSVKPVLLTQKLYFILLFVLSHNLINNKYMSLFGVTNTIMTQDESIIFN